ncbi:hypothetical protein WFA24289_01875 [Periweissella fabaria]|uniref:Uncharacterized protein n=1 Tax=Periweissella fabaria TaxID=546157 RepID=A0ABM8Z8J5_9LACO|nr:hypothetical protein [Periweissella fabaria]CAH0417533.1 hypothetical protein WFA24289_01875 [Periweissella fabaria]
MKKESWQGVKGSLVYEDDKAIIVDNSEDLKDIKKLSNQISENGKPIYTKIYNLPIVSVAVMETRILNHGLVLLMQKS